MKRSKPLHRLSGALALALCAQFGVAHAQSDSGSTGSSYLILPSISLMKPDSNWPTNKTGYGGGLKFGMPVSPDWDLQFGANYARSRNDGTAAYHQWMLGVDGLYFFDRGTTRPFVLIGAGAERDRAGANGVVATRNSPFVNLGAGLQYRFSPTLGMQADVRYVEGFLGNGSAFGHKRSGNTYFNIGLTWYFDAPPVVRHVDAATPPPPPPPPPPVVAPPPPPPAPVPPPPPLPPKRFTLQASELFDFDKAVLKPNQPQLDDVARVLNANPGIDHVRITGYTDRLGSQAYNMKLSRQRAESVKHYLVAHGVAAGRLETEGRGEADPVSSCSAKLKRKDLIQCLEPDRRVVIEPINYVVPAKP
ncbi:OmpA family protein [Burkholderiaceae bacterium UC74_6]